MKNFVKLAIAFAIAAILLAPLAAAAGPALEIFDVSYDHTAVPGYLVTLDFTLRANSYVKDITITG